jgi:hypothetical protein
MRLRIHCEYGSLKSELVASRLFTVLITPYQPPIIQAFNQLPFYIPSTCTSGSIVTLERHHDFPTQSDV